MTGTALVLVPPLVVILLALWTRRIIPSLGVGIIISSFIYEGFDVVETGRRIGKTALHLFYADGSLAKSNLYVLCFLLLLGVITGVITLLGGGISFGEFAAKKLKSKRQITLSTTLFGMTLFPDDVFNMFTNGQVSRPLFDRFGISRPKLAYMVHSTSDPLCVLTPTSSWGAYITSIFTVIFVTQNIDANPIITFVEVAFLNFYALTTIALVFLVAAFDINIGKMRKVEHRTEKTAGQASENAGNIWTLFLPILVLMIVSIGVLLWTGYRNSNSTSIIEWFTNGKVSFALCIGALSSSLIAIGLACKQNKTKLVPKSIKSGLKTTLPAVWILLFAWMQSELTGLLKTGEYLGSYVEHSSLSNSWLPFLLFLLTGIMAFSTGTSWGTFAIMLPIAAQIGLQIDAGLTPLFAAVLSGSLFGDHCSPISDTTTVAAAAAGCNHMDHVMTQLPYALTAALIAASAFFVYGWTKTIWFAYILIALVLTTLTLVYLRSEKRKTPLSDRP